MPGGDFEVHEVDGDKIAALQSGLPVPDTDAWAKRLIRAYGTEAAIRYSVRCQQQLADLGVKILAQP